MKILWEEFSWTFYEKNFREHFTETIFVNILRKGFSWTFYEKNFREHFTKRIFVNILRNELSGRFSCNFGLTTLTVTWHEDLNACLATLDCSTVARVQGNHKLPRLLKERRRHHFTACQRHLIWCNNTGREKQRHLLKGTPTELRWS